MNNSFDGSLLRTETETTETGTETTETGNDHLISSINLIFWQFYAGN